jgi:dipeptidyl aminopeptidase/acylaminoacyl peptidase
MSILNVVKKVVGGPNGLFLTGAVTLLGAVPLQAQSTDRIEANWELANRFSNEAINRLVPSTSVSPNWIAETDSAWYHWRDSDRSTFYLLVPKARSKAPLFDHAKMAAALSEIGGRPHESHRLPFTTVDFTKDLKSIRFTIDSLRYEWDLSAETLKSVGLARDDSTATRGGGGGGGQRGGGFMGGGGTPDFRNYSPDSTAFAFAKEHNLYLVEVGKPDTVQLTFDGEEYYSFGWRDTAQSNENNRGGGQQRGGRERTPPDPRVRASVNWSPDSKAFVVTRRDQREVSELYLVDVLAKPRPKLVKYKYTMPGEENVTLQELFLYRRGDTGLEPLEIAPRWKDESLMNIHWTTGSSVLRFLRRDRLQRNAELVELDLASKATRVLLSEGVENSRLETQGVRYVKSGGDMIWFSERSGWGHYYLYDHNGNLKRQLTSGEWRADRIAAVDSVRRVVWVSGVGREPGENVYNRHLYRINVDNGALTLLDQENASHNSSLSPSNNYIVSTGSRIDLAPTTVLRDRDGRVIMELEKPDLTPLYELGWKLPEPFVVKAADGVTDIYGNMWKPFDFDPEKKYPIIAYVYPGPQTEAVTSNFTLTGRVTQQLAQLGFIVIEIGNRGGTPERSNAYHSHGYYNLRDYGLADKKVGIEQLAARHTFIDIDRVGLYGHSGGGFMTAAALLVPPYNDFFKVGVSSAGNHDNNVYNQNWSESNHGLKEVRTRSTTTTVAAVDSVAAPPSDSLANVKFEIKVPTNAEVAGNLKGKLLLVHGDMDNNVHHAGTMRLVEALIKANKRFDFMLLPGKAHGFADMQGYFNRMLFEYFAEHLLGDYQRSTAEIR